MRKTLILTGSVILTAIFAFVLTSSAQAQAFPEVIPLPNGFAPEGIVVGKGPVAYAGSLANGDIYEVNLLTGEGEIFAEGPGTPSVGLSFDRNSGYLYVSGGNNGDARVYDTESGELVNSYDFSGGFVNDAIVTNEAVYFTDSFAPTLYSVALESNGEPASSFDTISLGGEFVAEEGFNSNGIEALPNGEGLIVVHSGRGELYLVDPQTGEASLIDLGEANVNNGDGMVLVGDTLYVVQNQLNQIAEFQLSEDYQSASLVGEITSSNFDVPTTADYLGSRLYAVNARFGTEPGPDVTYDIVQVRR